MLPLACPYTEAALVLVLVLVGALLAVIARVGRWP
jgi:hypothetical protein